MGGSIESVIFVVKLGIFFVFVYFINGEEEVLKEVCWVFDVYFLSGFEVEFYFVFVVFVVYIKEEVEKYIVLCELIKVVLKDGCKVNVGFCE